MRYQKLLSPIMIGGQIIKNRLTYPNASPHFSRDLRRFRRTATAPLQRIWPRTARPS